MAFCGVNIYSHSMTAEATSKARHFLFIKRYTLTMHSMILGIERVKKSLQFTVNSLLSRLRRIRNKHVKRKLPPVIRLL